MKEVPLKILSSVSPHSRFVLSTPHRFLSFSCCLSSNENGQHSFLSCDTSCFDSSNQSLSLSWLSTDGICSLFPSPLGCSIHSRILLSPCCLCTASTLAYIMHSLLYTPFALRIHFDLAYPKHEEQSPSSVSTAPFCQNRTFS